MKNYAKFEIQCDFMNFSRSHQIPIASRGYIRELVEDLDRAFELYLLKVENNNLKTEKEQLTPRKSWGTDVGWAHTGKCMSDCSCDLNKSKE